MEILEMENKIPNKTTLDEINSRYYPRKEISHLGEIAVETIQKEEKNR